MIQYISVASTDSILAMINYIISINYNSHILFKKLHDTKYFASLGNALSNVFKECHMINPNTVLSNYDCDLFSNNWVLYNSDIDQHIVYFMTNIFSVSRFYYKRNKIPMSIAKLSDLIKQITYRIDLIIYKLTHNNKYYSLFEHKYAKILKNTKESIDEICEQIIELEIDQKN